MAHKQVVEHSLKSFLESIEGSLKIPSYQRAYSWGAKQLNDFVKDLEEYQSASYYYGHFILEKANGTHYIIDGQQRLTTYVLFLLVCQNVSQNQFFDYDTFIEKLEAVDYDNVNFSEIKKRVKTLPIDTKWDLDTFHIAEGTQTTSIRKIVEALEFFRKAFKDTLQKDKIPQYLEILHSAIVSTHLTNDKAVSAQIFELHNTRGIKLDLIERIKSKLMKTVLLSDDQRKEEIIQEIQNNFGEIYRLEDKIEQLPYFNRLSLETILFNHLRVYDAGDKKDYEKPASGGENLMAYIEDQLNPASNAVGYITALSKSFMESCQFIANDIERLVDHNPLIADVLFLRRNRSLQLFLLLRHTFTEGWEELLQNEKLLRKWELLLFISDYHSEYYNRQLKDNYEELFEYVANKEDSVENILDEYLYFGFRPTLFGEYGFQNIGFSFIVRHKPEILQNAYWSSNKEKIKYLLYKYEVEYLGVKRDDILEIVNSNLSLEHILPEQWKWSFIDEDPDNLSPQAHSFNNSIKEVINGVGNLLLITQSENSSLSNEHPKDKEYSPIGGSYCLHNKEREVKWANPEGWKTAILERGEKIYDFLLSYFYGEERKSKAQGYEKLYAELVARIEEHITAKDWIIDPERKEERLFERNRGILWVRPKSIESKAIIGIEDLNPLFPKVHRHFDNLPFIGIFETNYFKKVQLEEDMPHKEFDGYRWINVNPLKEFNYEDMESNIDYIVKEFIDYFDSYYKYIEDAYAQ